MRDALERGRLLLDSMPYPENVENHFVVDSKFDFYAMDCAATPATTTSPASCPRR